MEKAKNIFAKTPGFIANHKKKILVVTTAAVCLLVFVLIGSLLFGKSDREQILDCLNNYATAFNSGDTKGMYACLDAKSQNFMQASENIGSGLLGVGLGDLFSVGAGLNAANSGFKFEVRSITMDGKKNATVDLTVHMTTSFLGMTSTDKMAGQLQMVKEKGDWLICAMEDV